jgi:excisionase family DNA binding protein
MEFGGVEVYSVAEAAARIGVAPVTLRLQIQHGALRASKVGGRYLITADDLAAYDERRKQPRGFARPDHPLFGKRGGGGRRRKGRGDES